MLLSQKRLVLLAEIDDQRGVRIVDPPREYWVTPELVESHWTGEALLISDRPLLPDETPPQPWPWFAIIAGLVGAGALLLGLVLLLRPNTRDSSQ